MGFQAPALVRASGMRFGVAARPRAPFQLRNCRNPLSKQIQPITNPLLLHLGWDLKLYPVRAQGQLSLTGDWRGKCLQLHILS